MIFCNIFGLFLSKTIELFTKIHDLSIPSELSFQKISLLLLLVQEFKELWPSLDLVVDGGRIVEDEKVASRSGSTVVHLATQGTFNIVRNGRYIHYDPVMGGCDYYIVINTLGGLVRCQL